MAEELYPGSKDNQQKMLRYWTKYTIFGASFIVTNFPCISCMKTPWNDAPKFSTVLYVLYTKQLLFVCGYVEAFSSYALPIDGGSAKFEVPPPNF